MAASLSKENIKKIAKAKSLLEAVQILASEHEPSGMLAIKSAKKTGKLFFEAGRIRNAAFSPDAEEGEAALERLISLQNPKFSYTNSEAEQSSEALLDITISDYLAQIKPVKFDKVSDKKIPAKALFSISFLGGLGLCLYFIPANLKDNVLAPDAEQHARARLRQMIHTALSKDSQQEAAELAPSRTAKVKVLGVGKAAVPEELRFARYLVDKNKIESALPYYENVLRHEPNNIEVRMELINAYIATKKMHSARVLCIKTFKKKLNSEQIGAVWQLFGQCQTD